LFTASLVALFLALTVAHVAAQVLIPDPCEGLTPSDWQYWLFSCWARSGLASFSGFVVR
jgi:hypothetical protein